MTNIDRQDSSIKFAMIVNNLTKVIYFISALTMVSCKNQSRNELLIGNWKMIADTVDQKGMPPPLHIDGRGVSYEFINDSIVDTKRRYYKIARSSTRERAYRFLGTKTKYKFEGDSIKLFDLTDSTWENGRYLKTLTKDSLVLLNTAGERLTFLRHTYKDENTEDINVIALSSSGCFGTCPIINIIIDSNGAVTYYGERYIDKIGFFEGQITKEMFNRIRADFKKSAIKGLAQNYSVGWTDDETISTTFISNHEFINSIEDYGEAGPDELVWAYSSLRYLFEDLQLTKLDSTKVPFYLDLHYFRFEKGQEICDLTQSESFLLWNYLRNGTLVENKVTNRYNMGFFRNYTWFPSYDEMEDPYKEKTEEKVKRITTDGQLYTFEIMGQRTVTIDIGFNFFDVNQKFLSFREKGEYD
jgi:hypothetical protein